MPKILVITRQKYLKTRLPALLDFLRARVEVDVLPEEEICWKSGMKMPLVYDLVYTVAKKYLALAVVRSAEARGVPCYNSSQAIRIAKHHYWRGIVLSRAGILVPEVTPDRIPSSATESLPKTSVLTTQDFDWSYKRENNIIKKRVLYFERNIVPDERFKVWVYGDNVTIFKKYQKTSEGRTLVEDPENPELRQIAKKITETIGLKIAAIKFLRQDDNYYLTGLSSKPAFTVFPNGVEKFGEWLVHEAQSRVTTIPEGTK